MPSSFSRIDVTEVTGKCAGWRETGIGSDRMASVALNVGKSSRSIPDKLRICPFHKMRTTCYVEDRKKAFAEQSKRTFVPTTRGHRGMQIGITAFLATTRFFPDYRSKPTPIRVGLPRANTFSGML